MPGAQEPRIWCNASPGIPLPAILRLLERLVTECNGATASLTVSRGLVLPKAPAPGIVPLDRPAELRQAIGRFVAETQPRVAVFAGSDVMPVAIDVCSADGIATVLICGDTHPRSGLRRHWSDFRLRSRVRRVDHVFAHSAQDAQHLRRLGAPPDRIEVLGPLEEGMPTLPCNEEEWKVLADMTAGRPVWHASMIRQTELDAVEEAHRTASRTSHRLLLIVTPDDIQDGQRVRDFFDDRGWQARLRSDGDDPDSDTQVYVADEPGELGLWYRLAPISFIGASLADGDGGGDNPYGPAALGSAIVHGPAVSQFNEEFARLAGGGGTRCVADGAALGVAISELLSPDRAAQQAHRAWEVTFQGAEASDRVIKVIGRLLQMQAN